MIVFGIKITGDSSDRRMWEQGRILVLVLLGFTTLNYIYNGLFRPLSTEKIDFVAYYNAALAFKYGLPIYDHMTQFFQQGVLDYEGPLPYVYPPGFVLFMSPLAYLSFKQASLLWILMNQIFFFTGIVLLMKAIKRQYSWVEWITLVFVCLNFTPLFIDFLIGQCNIVLFFLITLGLYFYRVNKGIYSGMALALATVIKVIPGFLIGFMLWKRQYKAFVAGVALLLIIFMYSLLFFDADLYLWYFSTMSSQGIFDAYHDNHSLTGFFSRFLTHSVWTKGIFNKPEVAQICIFVGSILMLLSVLFVTRKKTDPTDDRSLREYSLVTTTMLLVTPLSTTPYLVMLLVPIGVLVHELFKNKPVTKWVYPLGAAYGIASIWYPLPVGKFLDLDVYTIYQRDLQAHIFSIQFFALVVLWCYFVFAPLPDSPNDNDIDEILKNRSER